MNDIALPLALRQSQPTLTTERLLLRALALADAPTIQQLAGDREVADTTRLIPHPYPDGLAETWIASLQPRYEKGEGVSFGIALKDGPLIGSIGLLLNLVDHHGELGYWIGKAWWNQGICTEAAAAVLGYAFETLELERVFANYFARNPASGRVISKLGMKQEGILRRHRCKWGQYEDLIVCGILRGEHQSLNKARARKRSKKAAG
ncbi:MAG: GNAT family N-acetyltransferase [Pirellulaceae bacterium]|nr:GNAT family N-acetyltransferase [Pirellulaceae bacterium]